MAVRSTRSVPTLDQRQSHSDTFPLTAAFMPGQRWKRLALFRCYLSTPATTAHRAWCLWLHTFIHFCMNTSVGREVQAPW